MGEMEGNWEREKGTRRRHYIDQTKQTKGRTQLHLWKRSTSQQSKANNESVENLDINGLRHRIQKLKEAAAEGFQPWLKTGSYRVGAQ